VKKQKFDVESGRGRGSGKEIIKRKVSLGLK